MKVPRINSQVCKIKNNIYVIGGTRENQIRIHLTEIYNLTTDEWKWGPDTSDFFRN
jgi:hypothetical protein